MRASLAALPLLLIACGYTVRGAARPIHVAPVRELGADVDSAALVAVAVRRAIARGPSTTLADGSAGQAELRVEMLDSASGLAPFADPGLRAAQYKASVRLQATLVGADGRALWTSPPIVGESPYLGVPGPLETLDGARRRALARAAEDAAERLVASLAWRDLE